MIELTEQQSRALGSHPNGPIEVVDPITRRHYVLLAAEEYQPAHALVEGEPIVIPSGIRRSQEAFRRDLPGLLQDRRLCGQWAAYHGEQRVGIAARMADLTRECLRRGLDENQFYIGLIDPTELIEEEEIDRSSGEGYAFLRTRRRWWWFW